MAINISFDRVGHFVRIPVSLPGGVTGRFLVDTGIGVTVVHPSFVDRVGLERTGEDHVGHRMSGQELRIPLVRVPQLNLGDHVLTNALAGVADLGETEGANGFDGILGLDLLGELPLTVDPFAHMIRLGVLGADTDAATLVPVRLHRDGLSIDLRADLQLPNGQVIEVEVDTGSGSTILGRQFMSACGVDGHENDARTQEGTDETGHQFVRYFVPIEGVLMLATAPGTMHERPTVMFQEIELDGLIGTDFLDRYVQTYDTRNSTIVLTPA